MSKYSEIYPWQESLWQSLHQARHKQHHALLMHGRSGIGKYDFALSFSKVLLCHNAIASGIACNKCPSCHWFDDEAHPDFRLVSPEQETAADDDAPASKKIKKKTQISVAQIRELSDFLGLSSHQTSGSRVVLIHPAEALNQASANALLKMLEEPSPGVIFILVTHHLQRLLPTIISRCCKVTMPVPDRTQSLAWLHKQGVQHAEQQLAYLEGSPIQVLSEQAQFAGLAEIWKQLALGRKMEPQAAAPAVISSSVETGIIAIQKWLYDIAAVKFGLQARYHSQHVRALQALADKVNLGRLFDLQKKTNELRKLATHPLNHELQMENLLLEYIRIFQN